MLVSLRWLRHMVGAETPADEIARLLTAAGLEVENMTDLGLASGKIVVARVLSFEKHPEADRLNLVKADVAGERPLDIVCGAQNLREGMLVPCALVGAELPGGIKIKRSKIRGRESEGMLCSGKELNLGSDHSGILELPDSFKTGEPFEAILEIKVTPNRADCLSVTGLARELAAMLGRKRSFPTTYRFTETLGVAIERFLEAEVTDRAACPRYAMRIVRDVKIEPSPLAIRRTLEACGLRPVNNVVDVTNYVMLELGNPMHAFDHAKLRGGRIVVRFAREGESLETIDGREVKLHPEDLVIADAERPVALAGVMGGRDTQVTDVTTRVAIECASFNPSLVRRTAKRHGFHTDSSYRFERGVDRAAVGVALSRATQLIHEFARGDVARGAIDIQGPHPEPLHITLQLDRVERMLGLELSRSEIADKLASLGFELLRTERDRLVVLPPSWRVDMAIEADLIEEIARVHGYDRIPTTMPGVRPRAERPDAARHRKVREIREALASAGFQEAIHFSFMAEGPAARHGFDPAAQPRLANPLSSDQAILRPTLLPALLETVGRNQRNGAERVALFEIGKVFKPGARPGHAEDERLSLGVVLTGHTPANWSAPAREHDFFDLSGELGRLGERLGLGPIDARPPAPGSTFHPGRGARVFWGGVETGVMGELHPDLGHAKAGDDHAYDLRGRVLAAEIDLDAVLERALAYHPAFVPVPKFPGSTRDIAILVDEALPAGDLLAAATKLGRPLAEEVALVDLYSRATHAEAADRIPEGRKSVALRFRLRDPEATLVEERIHETMERVVKGLGEKFGAVLR